MGGDPPRPRPCHRPPAAAQLRGRDVYASLARGAEPVPALSARGPRGPSPSRAAPRGERPAGPRGRSRADPAAARAGTRNRTAGSWRGLLGQRSPGSRVSPSSLRIGPLRSHRGDEPSGLGRHLGPHRRAGSGVPVPLPTLDFGVTLPHPYPAAAPRPDPVLRDARAPLHRAPTPWTPREYPAGPGWVRGVGIPPGRLFFRGPHL